MTAIDKDCFATLEFEMYWESNYARHRERYLARKVNIWRDFFPPGMEESLQGLAIGESIEKEYAPGEALPQYRDNSILNMSLERFRPQKQDQTAFNPYLGRFYPKGFLTKLTGIYPNNFYPFRVIDLNKKSFRADLNHPMAAYPFKMRVYVHNVAVKDSDVGGKCSVWLEELADMGPGMQVRYKDNPTHFQLDEPLSRPNQEDDKQFYAQPRMVGHIDSQASENLEKEYAKYLSSGSKVLDLMSSLQSHMPMDLDMQVTGLGLNEEELRANSRLSDYVVKDINYHPELPFATASFDTVVCSLSLEYLVCPQTIVAEIRRVLKPGGQVLISLSNRWFSPKTIDIWPFLYEYERMGLVLELLVRDSGFTDMETVSYRNWWRPKEDKWFGYLWVSDPIYILAANTKET